MVRLVLTTAVATLIVSGHAATSAPLLDLRLSQRMLTAPGALSITAFVAKDEANRSLTIEAESEGFYRSSLITLQGAASSRTHSVRYTSLPEGEYLIRVSLHGADLRLAVTEQTAEVFGRPPESSPPR